MPSGYGSQCFHEGDRVWFILGDNIKKNEEMFLPKKKKRRQSKTKNQNADS